MYSNMQKKNKKVINWIKKKWFHDPLIQDLVKDYPLIQKLWYVNPLQKQCHIWFWHLIPCRTILYFLTPCRSKVTDIIYFSTPCRSKVTTLFWYVDPLQKQGHIWFWHLIPAEARSHLILALDHCRSKVLAIIYFLTPYKGKVTTFPWYVDPL